MFDSATVFSSGLRIGGADAREFLPVLGQAIAEAARRAARAKGGRRFWREVASSVNVRRTGDGVTVGATHVAARQKQFGGRISAPGSGPGALGAKSLTIPLGKARENRWTTRDARRLYELFRPKGRNFLMGRPRAGGEAEPLFALRKSVSQGPDPWFPTGPELEAIFNRALRMFRRVKGGSADVWIR